ncbi:glycosyltransferase [Blastochloris sulfoviridis]|uniref:Glycosyltransferase n=1 Tax=Blastochloris sulfoviridis TaxID=50712 RepID=A0A5M6HN97_9HYPH|nr:glycosyltransferase [Blastochloris sulfoviridis]KAA5597148.1 glycosyltransferase [Blastochloris sulfoviridis]
MTASQCAGGRPVAAFVLPSFAGGGAERVTLNLLRLVDRTALRPMLVVLDPIGPLSAAVPDDVPVLGLGHRRLRTGLPRLIAALRDLRPHAVFSTFTYLNLPLLAARPLLRGARLVVREANMPSESLATLRFSTAFQAGCRWLYPGADCVVATSERMRAELRSMGVPAGRLCVLPNPVDVDNLRQAAVPPHRHPGPGLRLVAVGRLVPAKGFDRLIEATAQLPKDAHCTILGEGPERPRLMAAIAQLGLEQRVAMPGFVATPARWMAGADALVLPSRYEGMPNVALEALAVGTPVIATPEAGGIAEVSPVTIAPAGRQLVDAIKGLAAAPSPAAVRPCLLPQAFRLEAVRRQVNDLLSAVETVRR